jgi:hypothetical protein
MVLAVGLVAGAAATAQAPSAKYPPPGPPQAGSISNGIYRNEFFGVECNVPAGWVLRTADMAPGQDANAKSMVLLSAFARTPHTAGAGVDSSILIAAEAQSSQPEAATALEYLVAVKQAANQNGLELTEPPREVRAGAHILWRADFAGDAEAAPPRYQISEVMLKRGYFVSFTFVAGSGREAEELLAKLHFLPPARKPAARKP